MLDVNEKTFLKRRVQGDIGIGGNIGAHDPARSKCREGTEPPEGSSGEI